MAIWRGPGGPGDAVPDQANSAQLAENFANAAAASAASALTSESNAAASAAAALVSESNASTSASQASSSESNAASSASAALASEQAAALSESNAASSESNAASSESNAASSESNAAASEANALASEQAAALSESNAASSESNAAASESKAQQWATEAEDVPVETSPTNLYSAFHWAQKSEDFAQTINPTDYVTVANNQTITGVKTFDNGLATDTISEETTAAGVTIDGVLLKDSEVTTDVIKEKTSAAGVTIDGVLLKDNAISATGPSVISVNSSSNALRITQVGTGNALLVEDSANPDSSPVVITGDGDLVVGATSDPYGGVALVSTVGNNATGNFVNNQYASGFRIFKSRGGTAGSQGILSNGDQTGDIRFSGSDGVNFIQNASIRAEVDGTPGTNDMPGRLTFSTTADGASSPTERMRIDSAGNIGINATAPAGQALRMTKNITGSTSGYGVNIVPTFQSDVTSGGYVFHSLPSTQATTFTLTNMYHYYAAQGTFGAGSTVTNQFGFRAESSLTGATNNYGFYSNIASGTGRWNFYANGTANNYFAGQVQLGAGTVSAPALSTTGDTNTGIYFPAADTIGFVCGGTEDFRVDGTGQLWNTVQSEVGTDYTTLYKGYFCRAWVNFDGTGTPAIRASGNVSSITDNGTGDYTVNFTTAMADANYSFVGTSSHSIGSTTFVVESDTTTPTTTAVRLYVMNASGTAQDRNFINVAIFR